MGFDRRFERGNDRKQKEELSRVLRSIRADGKDQDRANRIASENPAIPLFENQTERSARLLREREQLKHSSNQPVIADIGNSPEGAAIPTHLRMNGILYMLIPPADYQAIVNQAFNRGYQDAVGVYSDQIQKPRASDQRTYVEMVRAGKWGDGQ